MNSGTVPKGVILDLGDVLFSWSATTATQVPASLLREILSSKVWEQYECGLLERTACFDRIAQQFSLSPSELEEAFAQARGSCKPNQALVTFIQDLKHRFRESLKIYAMSNTSKDDYDVLAADIANWAIFNRVFTSGYFGTRKPDPRFFKYVLQETHLSPAETLFIDDKLENVEAARSLGINSIVFDDSITVTRSLEAIFDSPLGKAYQFLHSNAPNYDLVTTNNGIQFNDNFARLMIANALRDEYILPFFSSIFWQAKDLSSDLMKIKWGSRRTWNYFAGKPVLVSGDSFPDDLDTTSLALTTLRPDTNMAASLLDEMLTYQNPDGSFQVFFDHGRPRVDEIVTANVLACFYTFGRGHESNLDQSLRLVREFLEHRNYLNGTLYYPSPDACLYFMTRLLGSSDDEDLHEKLEKLLRERMAERIGQVGDALDLAMRIVACESLNIGCGEDRKTLLEMQCTDGGWQVGWIYQHRRTGTKIGSRALTTSLAIQALKC